jgi:predicted ATP-grasp superfamily ATP-dependent carboligase
VAAGGTAVLLGVTRQLVGTSWTGAQPFSYAGSLGPLSLPPDQDAAFRQIGDCLAAEFRLTGLFGVDAIVNDEGVWPVEVNPRYPASAEVLERAGRFSAVRLHAEACRSAALPPPLEYGHRVAGKAIVFAAAEVEVTEALVDWAEGENRGRAWPAVADLPHPGSRLPQGGPVLTVLCEGTELPDVEAQLRRQIVAANELAGRSAAGC